ncbi:DNA cytosine methyltransferase [Leucobacter triazinivorans]|uniref:DNA cytosine methyltransferase n=1 Tax=Leucobacter triazinivorans TaxID=1784719 RepID=UPI00197FBA59|nr:DNA cytosine methyltransferase [Leucobacter triazinivorans]
MVLSSQPARSELADKSQPNRHQTLWFSEINEPVARVFSHHWPDAPNLGDITTIEWSTVPPVDILCGGFPCQDVSTVGKMAGLKPGTRSGLWAHMATAIDALQPDWVVIENVRGLLSAPRAPRKPRRR